MLWRIFILPLFMSFGLSFLSFAQQVSVNSVASDCQGKTGEITVSLPNWEPGTVELYNFKGDLLLTKAIQSEKTAFSDLPPGIYSIKVAQANQADVTKTVKVLNLSYEEEINLDTFLEDTRCALFFDGWKIVKGFPILNFSNFDMTGYQSLNVYFFDDFGNNYQTQDKLDAGIVGIVSIGLDPGVYHVLLEWNGCYYPVERDFVVSKVDLPSFEIDDEYLMVCGQSVTIKPKSDQDLEYELYRADGTLIGSGREFEIKTPGTYKIQNIPGDFCAIYQSFSVRLIDSAQVPQVEKQGNVCDGKLSLVATIDAHNLKDSDFTWYDYSTDQKLASGVTLEITQDGTYYVVFGDPDNSTCASRSEPVDVQGIKTPFEPVLELENADWCEADFNKITLKNVPEDPEIEIRWYRAGELEEEEIPEAFNLYELEIVQAGVYTVTVISGTCSMKERVIQVTQVHPHHINIESTYDLCLFDEAIPLVLQGEDSFKSLWFLEDRLVGDQNTFTPEQAGNYRLENYYSEKCFLEYSFVVTSNCAARVSFTNGMRLSDPDRNFAVFTNRYVEKLSVKILNRWGNLLFYADETHPNLNSSQGIWEGTFSGKPITADKYPLLILYTGSDGKVNEIRSTLTVIE